MDTRPVVNAFVSARGQDDRFTVFSVREEKNCGFEIDSESWKPRIPPTRCALGRHFVLTRRAWEFGR